MGAITMIVNPHVLLERHTELIQGCIDGNMHFQSRLYELFAPKMFAVCLRYSRSREEAEEVLQEGFVQVFRSLKSFKQEGALEGWIRKIMVYSCVKHYKSNIKMHPVVTIESAGLQQTETEDSIARLGKKELLQMVQALPPAYRLVFNLYVFEGMKHREIAEHLGISEGTSKSNLFDAKMILQRAVNNSVKIARQQF